MEYNSSTEDLKDESPSQEHVGYTHPMKLDIESVDDFEHITKDISPSKEATALFLQHEATYASNRNEDNGRHDTGDISSYSDVKEEDEPLSLPTKISNNVPVDPSSLSYDNRHSPEINFPTASSALIDTGFGEFDNGSSKNFMQYERVQDEGQGNASPLLSQEMTEDDEKLIDFGSSPGFGEIPSKPADVILNKNSEILEPDTFSDIKNMSPTVPSQSLPGFVKENETDVHSEIIPQGDGLHLKQTPNLDASDTEDHVPEPLPKDYPEIGVIEPKDFLSAIGIAYREIMDTSDVKNVANQILDEVQEKARSKLTQNGAQKPASSTCNSCSLLHPNNWFRPDRLNPKVESLIYWRDVKKSAIAFTGGFAVLLSLCYYSLISVVAYTSLAILGASLSLKVYQNLLQTVQKSTDNNPLKLKLAKILQNKIVVEVFEILKEYLEMGFNFDQEKVREGLDAFIKNLHHFIVDLRRRFLFEDIIDSLKFGVLLWTMTYIGSWFNGLSLLIMSYVGLFTLPKVYENNKTQIDSNLEIVREKINLLTDRIRAVIPWGKNEATKSKDE